MKHKHADLMLKYAQDAMVSETPWKGWSFKEPGGAMEPCQQHPLWRDNNQYYRMADVITAKVTFNETELQDFLTLPFIPDSSIGKVQQAIREAL